MFSKLTRTDYLAICAVLIPLVVFTVARPWLVLVFGMIFSAAIGTAYLLARWVNQE